VMGKRVQQFHHRLVVVAAGWGEQEAHDETRQTDYTMQSLSPTSTMRMSV
jgi:hypothetical protein